MMPPSALGNRTVSVKDLLSTGEDCFVALHVQAFQSRSLLVFPGSRKICFICSKFTVSATARLTSLGESLQETWAELITKCGFGKRNLSLARSKKRECLHPMPARESSRRSSSLGQRSTTIIKYSLVEQCRPTSSQSVLVLGRFQPLLIGVLDLLVVWMQVFSVRS